MSEIEAHDSSTSVTVGDVPLHNDDRPIFSTSTPIHSSWPILDEQDARRLAPPGWRVSVTVLLRCLERLGQEQAQYGLLPSANF